MDRAFLEKGALLSLIWGGIVLLLLVLIKSYQPVVYVYNSTPLVLNNVSNWSQVLL